MQHDRGRNAGRYSYRQHDQPVRSNERELRVGSGEVLRCDLVSDLHLGDTGADFHDSAPALGPGSERKRHLVEAGALVDLDEVQPSRMDLDQHFPRAGHRLSDLLVAQNLRPTSSVNADGLHVIPVG